MNEAIDNTLDRSDYQVLVLTPHRDDVTPLFFKNLSKSPLGPHPIASTADQKFPDTEPNIRFKNDSPSVQSLYVVSSVVSHEDYLYLLEKIDYYRQTLNVKCVTGIFPYLLSTRQDKNVDKNGNLVATPINIRAILGGLSPFVDRIVVFEPHSSATQAYAA